MKPRCEHAIKKWYHEEWLRLIRQAPVLSWEKLSDYSRQLWRDAYMESKK